MTNPLAKMASVLFAALMLGFAVLFPASDAYAGAEMANKRFALVVTNEHYPDIWDLHYSHSDGRITIGTLLDLGFEVNGCRTGQ